MEQAKASPGAIPSAAAVGLGAAIALGWLLHDQALLLVSPEPSLATKLLLPSLLLLVVSTAVVWVATRHWLLSASLAAALLAFGPVISWWNPAAWPAYVAPLPRVLLALGLAAVSGYIAHRWLGWASGWAPAFVASGLAASVMMVLRFRGGQREGVLLPFEPYWVAMLGLVLLASRFPSPRWRRVGLLCVLLLGVGLVSVAALNATRLGPSWQPSTRVQASEEAKNLIVLVLDTVGAHHLASYGYDRVTMPKLDARVAARGDLYREARSTSSWTLPSHGALFTGLYPSTHGSTHIRGELPEEHPLKGWPGLPLRKDRPTLAEQFATRGWRTGAVIGNSPFVSRRFNFDQGFEHFDDRPGAQLAPRFALVQLFGADPSVGFLAYRRAERITDLSLDWVRSQRSGEPFFLFANFMDAHAPYLPPASHANAFSTDQPVDRLTLEFSEFVLQYDRELLYLDTQVDRLLSSLEREGRLANTWVVITADHGETFGENGFWFHNVQLHEAVTRVPLYVFAPGQTEARQLDQSVHSVELHHLLLDWLGLESQNLEQVQPDFRRLRLEPGSAASSQREGNRPAPSSPGDSPRDSASIDAEATFSVIGEWYLDPKLAAKHPDPTFLLRDLLTFLEGSRKFIVGSRGELQLYDLSVDPWELKDLAGELSEEERQRILAQAQQWWSDHPPLVSSAGAEMDAETLERLRALGYVD